MKTFSSFKITFFTYILLFVNMTVRVAKKPPCWCWVEYKPSDGDQPKVIAGVSGYNWAACEGYSPPKPGDPEVDDDSESTFLIKACSSGGSKSSQTKIKYDITV